MESTFYAIHSWVHSFTINPNQTDPLQYIWNDRSHNQG